MRRKSVGLEKRDRFDEFNEAPDVCEICGFPPNRGTILKQEKVLGELTWLCGGCYETFHDGIEAIIGVSGRDISDWDGETFDETTLDAADAMAEGLSIVDGGKPDDDDWDDRDDHDDPRDGGPVLKLVG